MNKYNPNIHHRRSIRLRGYDYAQAGLYFITICVQDRECLFGHIVVPVGADLRVCPKLDEQDEQSKLGIHAGVPQRGSPPQMILNGAGQMVAKWYHELENKFPDIRCHEMVVMPNHFHCIVENVGPTVGGSVGADLPVGSDLVGPDLVGADLRVCPVRPVCPELGEHVGSPLHRVVQWFKTMTTNEYIRGVKNCGWQRFNGKLWQRNYYEHIIRNEKSYQNISNYILNNPANWNGDKLNH